MFTASLSIHLSCFTLLINFSDKLTRCIFEIFLKGLIEHSFHPLYRGCVCCDFFHASQASLTVKDIATNLESIKTQPSSRYHECHINEMPACQRFCFQCDYIPAGNGQDASAFAESGNAAIFGKWC
jgi:hypothetical protein